MGFPGDIFKNIGRLLQLKQAWDRIKKEARMGKLFPVLYGLGGFVLTAVVAKLTGACPDLISALPSVLTAAFAGAIAFWMNRPKEGYNWKSLLVGLGAAAWAGIATRLTEVCGSDFVAQLPTLATAGFWVGLGLWLKAPKTA